MRTISVVVLVITASAVALTQVKTIAYQLMEDGVNNPDARSIFVEQEEIPNFYRYGDSSSFYLLKKDSKPIGNYFTVREGSKTYTVILTGMYFDEAEVWKEIMEPKLKQFSVYIPT